MKYLVWYKPLSFVYYYYNILWLVFIYIFPLLLASSPIPFHSRQSAKTTLALASKQRNWENQRCKSCTEYFEYVHVTPGPAIFCSFVFCLGSLSPWQGFNFSLVEGKGWPNFMAHDAIPLQSKSLGNKATEGHMPLIFAILLQNFVHGRIYINAISSTINPDFATSDDNKNFGSFFLKD